MQRLLLLQRHAKSEWPEGVADLERPLSPRGQRDAVAAASWTHDACGLPELILVSPARRTRDTFEILVNEWSHTPEHRWEPRIYEASATDLAGVVREVSDDVTVLMIIGHNPGLEIFADVWTDGADPTAHAQLQMKFPTSAIATISLRGPWRNPTDRYLEQVVVPRGDA